MPEMHPLVKVLVAEALTEVRDQKGKEIGELTFGDNSFTTRQEVVNELTRLIESYRPPPETGEK